MDKGSTPFTSTNSAPLDKRLSRLPFTEEIRGSKPLRSTLYREIVAAVARQAHNLEVGGSNPSLATNKKIFVKILGNVKIFSDLYKVIRVEAIN